MRGALLMTVFVAVFVTGGCSRYYVSVDSINNGHRIAAGTRSCVVSGMPDVGNDDLRFREFAGFVERALKSKGYAAAEQYEDAEVVVVLSYDIEQAGQYDYRDRAPIYNDSPIAWTTTYGEEEGQRRGRRSYWETTTYMDGYDAVNAAPFGGPYFEYTISARLTAFKGEPFEDAKMLWQTDISSTGTDDDLRKVFPVMIGAAAPYLGENTRQRREVAAGENDQAVEMIRAPGN